MPHATSTVVIVGRPNVGKSTLFNRITGQRRAIERRAWNYARSHTRVRRADGRRFELIDTGGIVVDDHDYIPGQILRQAEMALKTASQIIFLVDGRAEITAPDRDLAQMLQRLGKPVTLAVNKADTAAREDLAHGFYELGIREVFPVSAEHGKGVDALLDHITAGFARDSAETPADAEAPQPEETSIKIAIIGRPNVGKSTLLNTLTGRSAPSSPPSPAPRETRWMKPWNAMVRSSSSSILPASAARARRMRWRKN